jgi:hypothetical protein
VEFVTDVTRRLERLEQAADAAMPVARRTPSFDTTDPGDPFFRRGAEIGAVYWDAACGNWRPVNPQELRALLVQRRGG